MKKYIRTSDEMKPQEIIVRGKHAQIKYTDRYYTDVYVDDNSRCFISWKHGGGEGEVVLPGGEVYDLPALLAALFHANPDMMDEWQLIEGTPVAAGPVAEKSKAESWYERQVISAEEEEWDDRDATYCKDGELVDVRNLQKKPQFKAGDMVTDFDGELGTVLLVRNGLITVDWSESGLHTFGEDREIELVHSIDERNGVR